MDEHSVVDILSLQTMLIAVGVIMYSMEANFTHDLLGQAVTFWFPVAVFLSSGARLFYNSGARYLAADSSE